ncbi:hypothetical protein JCM16814_16270 [Desulfobaculum senezii]
MAVAMTFDADWAPEPVLEYAVRLVESYGILATFYATNHSPALHWAARQGHEVGLHPFFGQPDASDRDTLHHLLDLYPDAAGVRNHRYRMDSTSIYLFAKAGLSYDCNIMAHDSPEVPPYVHHTGLVRFPLHFGDGASLQYGLRTPQDLLADPGRQDPVVLLFHPIHIYLNTQSMAHYARAKKDQHDMAALNRHVASGEGPGVREWFHEACAAAQQRGAVLMRDAADAITHGKSQTAAQPSDDAGAYTAPQ